MKIEAAIIDGNISSSAGEVSSESETEYFQETDRKLLRGYSKSPLHDGQ